MFRFDNILEAWACIYKPLSHDINGHGRKTFYRIDTINNNNEFVQNYNLAATPCMAYSTLVDASRARANAKSISYRHSIYFMVKQAAPQHNAKTVVNDADAETDAKYYADEMVQDLLAFLDELKKESQRAINGNSTHQPQTAIERIVSALPKEEQMGINGLQLDGAEWGTFPMKYNRWWVCGLEIEQISPRLLCVNGEKYY